MRITLLLAATTVAASILVGCGGGGGGGGNNNPPPAPATRGVIGFVYVEDNAGPDQGSDIIISPSTQPPPGYAVPTSGTVTLGATNGTFSGGSTTFNLAQGNLIVARVSNNTGAASTLNFSATDVELNGTDKGDISNQTLLLNGTNNSTVTLTFGSPTAPIVPGTATDIVAFARQTGTTFSAWDTLDDVLDPLNSGSSYEVVVVPIDANGVIVNSFNQSVSSNYQHVTVGNNSNITVGTTGTNGDPVEITYGITQNPALNKVFNTTYGGTTATLTATFTPAGPTTLNWEGAGGNVNFQTYTITVRDASNNPVPNEFIIFTRSRTSTGAGLASTYPAPASGTSTDTTFVTTDPSGQAVVTFRTPNPADGDFSGLNILGSNWLQARQGTVTGPVIGSTEITITRS